MANYDSYLNNIFGKRLENLLVENGLTQTELAEMLTTITNYALSSYVIGKRIPRIETAVEICDYFDVTLDYMFGRSECRKPVNQAVIDMPVYKTYNIGQNNYDESNIETYIPVAKSRFEDANNLFGYKIKTQKMNPRFYKGDIAIIRRTKEATSGDIVMITVGNEDAVIIELTTTNNGWVLNPFSYDESPQFYSWSDIEKLNVRLIGKVIENLVKF